MRALKRFEDTCKAGHPAPKQGHPGASCATRIEVKPRPAVLRDVPEPAPNEGLREIHRIFRPISYHLSCNVPETGVFAKPTLHLVLYT
jgi:hypothetical protein